MRPPEPTISRHVMPSAALDADRELLVYEPPGGAGGRRHAVLYMHDGQRLFDTVPGSSEPSWNLARTADALIRNGRMQPLVIVGICHAGARILDYTPTATRRQGGGGADRYLRFLVDEVRPFIDARYGVSGDAARTGLGGSSLGGLVSLYGGLCRPDVFGRLAVISPSVWWDRRVILREVRTRRPMPRPRIWLDMGTAEGWKALVDARLLEAGLRHAGWVPDRDLAYSEYPGARHHETAWAARAGAMLEYLFPATIAPFGPNPHVNREGG